MNTSLREVGILYQESSGYGANFLSENQVTTTFDLSQLLLQVADPHLHAMSL